MVSRRFFIGAGLGTLAVASGAGVLASENTTSAMALVEEKVGLANLAPPFEGYRIGFLTDPHLGVYVPTEWVDEAVGMLERARIDILLLGGDYIWYPDRDGVEHLYPIRNPRFLREEKASVMCTEIFSVMADLASRVTPPDGRFAVLGNHDGWTGPHLCKAEFKRRDIRVLENEVMTVTRGDSALHIYGTVDYWTGIPKRPPFSEVRAKNETRLLLTHNPDYTSELLGLGYKGIDLALSGHTHGGQIKLPIVGALHGNVADTRFREGFFRTQELISYTSRGVGVVEMPVRINCPPEVTVLELRRA